MIEGLSGAKGGSLETVADRLAYRSLGGGQRALSKIGPARAEKAGRAVREELGTGFGTRSLEENMSRLKAAHEEAGQTIGKIYSKMDNAQVGLPDARNIMERVMDDVYRPMFDNPASRNEAGKVLRELQPFLDDIQAGKTPTWTDLHGWRVEFDKKLDFSLAALIQRPRRCAISVGSFRMSSRPVPRKPRRRWVKTRSRSSGAPISATARSKM